MSRPGEAGNGSSEPSLTVAALWTKGRKAQKASFANFSALGLGIHLPSSAQSNTAVLTHRCAV